MFKLKRLERLAHRTRARRERDEAWWTVYAVREARYFTPVRAELNNRSNFQEQVDLDSYNSPFWEGYRQYAATHDPPKSPFIEGYKRHMKDEADDIHRYRGPRDAWGKPLKSTRPSK